MRSEILLQALPIGELFLMVGLNLLLHRTEGSDIFLSLSWKGKDPQLALIHHPAANSLTGGFWGDSSEAGHSTVSSAMVQVNQQRKSTTAFSVKITEDHIAGMLDSTFLSLQIYHVYWSRRLSCVDCKWALLTPGSASLQSYSPSSLYGKWGWYIYVPSSLCEGLPWLACISILKATVPVRRLFPYSYSLRWPSPSSPLSWERKWLPSVANREDYAIPSCFPYTLPCLIYKPYIKFNSIITFGHTFCFFLGWGWLTNSGVMQLPGSNNFSRS